MGCTCVSKNLAAAAGETGSAPAENGAPATRRNTQTPRNTRACMPASHMLGSPTFAPPAGLASSSEADFHTLPGIAHLLLFALWHHLDHECPGSGLKGAGPTF